MMCSVCCCCCCTRHTECVLECAAATTIALAIANGLHFVCHKHKTQLNELINDYCSRYAAAASRLMLTNKTNRTCVFKPNKRKSVRIYTFWYSKNRNICFVIISNEQLYMETSPIMITMLWQYLNKSSELELLHVRAGIFKIAFKSI